MSMSISFNIFHLHTKTPFKIARITYHVILLCISTNEEPTEKFYVVSTGMVSGDFLIGPWHSNHHGW